MVEAIINVSVWSSLNILTFSLTSPPHSLHLKLSHISSASDVQPHSLKKKYTAICVIETCNLVHFHIPSPQSISQECLTVDDPLSSQQGSHVDVISLLEIMTNRKHWKEEWKESKLLPHISDHFDKKHVGILHVWMLTPIVSIHIAIGYTNEAIVVL